MLVPLIWQKDYIKLDEDLKTITDRLSETGSHVEEVKIHTSDLDGVVVGKVLDQNKHPSADRLNVLTIDIGKDTPITIITNATNTKKGDYLPVITSGTKLDDDTFIDDHDFFGIISQGMLTAYSELSYDDSVVPKKLKDGVLVLEGEFEVGSRLSDVIYSNTPVIEYEITPNRPDCLSILGMARESAASFGKKITYPSIDYDHNDEDITDYFDGVDIESPNCNAFVARVATNIEVKTSPQWLQNYLILAGMRPINNIVDITNFVMLETGQPLHAYDLDKLRDNKIIVRDSKDSETLKTLDGNDRNLDEGMVLICDGQGPIGLAGIMGGMDSEVTEETTNILLEAANFDSSSIRSTSKKLGLRSEASNRFEKGLSPQLADFASSRAMKLINDLKAGTIIGGAIKIGLDQEEEKYVDLRISRLNMLTGLELTMDYAIKNLELLEFEVQKLDEDTLRAKVPYFRSDIEIEADLIEEVVRLYGMGKIESKPLRSSLQRGERSKRRLLRDDLREKLVGQKFSELATYSFISPREFDRLGVKEDRKLRDFVKLINPLGEDYSVMRTSQVPSMLDVISKNIKYGQKDMSFFELDRTFERVEGGLPKENLTLTMGLYGSYSFYDMKDFFREVMANVGFDGFTYKANTETFAFHKGRCADIYYDDQKIGMMGDISYEIRDEYDIEKGAIILEVNLALIEEKRNPQKKYKEISRFPAIERDYSLVCDRDVESAVIEKIIIENSEGLVGDVKLFDIYTGEHIEEGKKSVSYKLSYRSKDRTLKDKEANKVEANIIEKLKEAGIELRS
ncbi:phenylalanine--tRNA ligase subunit beta [Anaerococcus sp. AGMB09787]|uniref:phenylalanine--tRNA ligase subunit beta n=1 Tax=Anaerococcus sp. AGMB09787 TaxID=2922869 RepID=UPI001FAF29D2|nr:phenylalanine--tRNA ligase subunit beta [Anaerococcus sp. AGMB09787]